MKFEELELKYFVTDLSKIEAQLVKLQAICSQTRVKEVNIRFDTPDYSLSREGKALRLRYDREARLTFKGPSLSKEGIRLRQEIEFVAGDFQAAEAFLTALGYQVFMVYEKYRKEYKLGEVHLMLDEMPYGNFVEIEGPDPDQIQAVNDLLGLDRAAQIVESYSVLFDQLRQKMKLPFRDLTFANFQDLKITADDLGVRPAD
jgi:adenylate cyclase, class 2